MAEFDGINLHIVRRTDAQNISDVAKAGDPVAQTIVRMVAEHLVNATPETFTCSLCQDGEPLEIAPAFLIVFPSGNHDLISEDNEDVECASSVLCADCTGQSDEDIVRRVSESFDDAPVTLIPNRVLN